MNAKTHLPGNPKAARLNAAHFAIFFAALFAALPARAQTPAPAWPSKPVAIIIGLTPGAATDIEARLYAQRMTENLGRSVIVDYKPGAGSTIATHYVVKSAPDGHNIIVLAPTFTFSNLSYPNLPYDPLKDFVTIGLATSSIPEFVNAAVLMSVFCVHWKIGHVFASNYPKGTGLIGQIPYLVWPALAMALAYFGYIARMTRAGVISALNSDYVRTATMKGLSKNEVMRKHVLRNALAPTITVISVQIGYLFGGIIGVEKVFNYFGLGSTMLRAVGAKDIPVLQGAVLLVGIVYMLSTLLADLLIAVFAKMAASAALAQGRTEEEFITPMRETFLLLQRREQEQRANTH